MDFEHSPRAQEYLKRLTEFQEQEITPREYGLPPRVDGA